MRNIAIFYHCLFYLDGTLSPLPSAAPIVYEQMQLLKDSGLLKQADFMLVGINGGQESLQLAKQLLPEKAQIVLHGLKSRSENLTIVEIEKWVPTHPGWNVLYFHSKGATHPPGSPYGDGTSAPWRRGMMYDLVTCWRNCVVDLQSGNDVVCSHFMRNMADGTQHIAAGNFWWASSDFLKTVPSIYLRDRIKMSGIGALESRYEAEVWLCNAGIPKVKEYRPRGGGGVP